jgi:ATP-dependent helicase HrpB
VLGDDAPVIAAEGRLHPVEIVYAPPAPRERPADAMAALVLRAVREQEGDVLAFLPGIGEIRRVQALLAESLPATVDALALAGALSVAEQDLALAPSPPGRRRVVLATDIAESSLTVAGVSVVVDNGLVKVPRLDTGTGMSRLVTVATSRASTDQRAGRAGRTAPGVAYRLWSKLEQGTRRAHLDAEITAVDLTGLALEIAAWGTPVERLRWADPPPPRALQHGGELLLTLGALDDAGRITDAGRRMLDLPLHPRLAHMVIAADTDDRFLACLIATLLDERDILRGQRDELPADLAMRVAVVCGHGDDRADRRDVARARERTVDLARRARIQGDPDELLAGAVDRADRCGRVLALAYPDRLAVRRSQPGRFQLRSGAAAWVPATDTLADEPFLVAGDLDGKRDNARIRLAAAMSAADVAAAFADEVEQREQMVWDKGRDDLVVTTEQRLGGMLLNSHTSAAPPGPPTTAAMVERVRATKMAVLRWDEAAVGLRARVEFVRRECDADDWPDWSDRALLATLDEWLAPYLGGMTGRADIERLDIAMVLAAQLGWDRSQRLAELAPPRLATPSGREVAIDYGSDNATASVRVQDLFGVDRHPCVADGRVPIVLELLSPADRPLQVTSDLPGFWAGSWAEVRKEMAGRYPKHHWPADPSKAVPKRLKDR